MEGSYKVGSVRPSGCFLGIVPLVFSKFWHGVSNQCEVLCDSQIFWEKPFCLKIWGNGPEMGQKQGFLNLLKSLVINFN